MIGLVVWILLRESDRAHQFRTAREDGGGDAERNVPHLCI